MNKCPNCNTHMVISPQPYPGLPYLLCPNCGWRKALPKSTKVTDFNDTQPVDIITQLQELQKTLNSEIEQLSDSTIKRQYEAVLNTIDSILPEHVQDVKNG